MLHVTRIGRLLLSGLALLLIVTTTASANDYLEVQRHYQVYSGRRDAIHFKIPVWAYGSVNDYHLNFTNTDIYYKIGNNETRAIGIGGNPEGDNRTDKNDRGEAYLYLFSGQGSLIVTNAYDGNPRVLTEASKKFTIPVHQVSDDDCPRVTIVEFDWYPPASLNGQTFTLLMKTDIRTRNASSADYNPTFYFSGSFQGADNIAAPQLYTPYLYMVNETGVTGYGLAAVPYYTQAKPLSYTDVVTGSSTPTSSSSGTIYVPTSDTLLYDFSAQFQVYRNEDTGEQATIRSNTVPLPAYHRLYDLQTSEEQDDMGSLTGSNVVQWTIRHPEDQDIIDGDLFEVQRAYKDDYSDAQTVASVPMTTGRGIYQYVDEPQYTSSGQPTMRTDTMHTTLSVTQMDTIVDEEGNRLCGVEWRLTADKFIRPAAPVYYRVRRASASVWGWDHDFAQEAVLEKHNYLAPLALTQQNYRPDTNFTDNRLVHFWLRLENANVAPRPLSIDDCNITYEYKGSYDNSVNYTITYDSVYDKYWGYTHNVQIRLYVVTPDGEEMFGPQPGLVTNPGTTTIRVPVGSTILRTWGRDWDKTGPNVHAWGSSNSYTHIIRFADRDIFETVEFSYINRGRNNEQEMNIYWQSRPTQPTEEMLARINALDETRKLQLYPKLTAGATNYGKCLWDKTAKLILLRTMEELGQTIELPVPADSIVRQGDGSWLAHVTDVADSRCMHYSYAARIDQTEANLRVYDSIYLRPVPLYGPSLYSDEAPTITSFTASKGNAKGSAKTGVLLNWTASTMAVDEFVLLRIPKNSSASADTIYRGTENTWFDTSAVPDMHYEYTVVAKVNCNGQASENSATDEGWRSPYGEISGTVVMPDNSGMAAVQVSLSVGGNTLKTITTGADGAYVFDSLTYNLSSGTVYTVTPTSQYGTFSYNNTSSGVASISLSADNAIAGAVTFVNTSSARVSGRVLYHHSTIPVADALFILNGDTVKRNGTIYHTGTDGNFELTLPLSMPCRLRVAKQGHTFLGDGWLFVTEGDTTFSLVKPLDGVRFYDTTKVRLVGRVAGGNDQKALKHGFGLGKNNLGDDLQLVLQLEGDNTAHIVHDPDDLTRDTLHYAIEGTQTTFEQKRIIIRPDIVTGEYAVDLFPVKYKVVQATARGYATLFAVGQGSETFDLSKAPLTERTDSLNGRTVRYNAVYDRIYRSSVQVKMTQILYGQQKEGYGEEVMPYTDITGVTKELKIYNTENGETFYTMGYPIFLYNRQYQFMLSAFEEYWYNNTHQSGRVDRVPVRRGSAVVRNGMHSTVESQTFQLDSLGQNKNVLLKVDMLDVTNTGTNALKTVSVALQTEGNTVETDVFEAYVSGNIILNNTLRSTDAGLQIVDIIRDPGGHGSSSWVESGSTYKYSYSTRTYWKLGAKIGLAFSSGITQDIGVVSVPLGAGTYAGATYSTQRGFTIAIPLTWESDNTTKYSYEFSTSDRISTGSSYGNVGGNADIFLGATRSVVTGLAESVALISDSLWEAKQPAYQAGILKLVAEGTDTLGNHYYLVRGQKTVLGGRLNNTFVYTQHYILNTLIPGLARQRQNLLEYFPDEETAQAAADQRNEPVYWLYDSVQLSLRDTLQSDSYEMFVPSQSTSSYVDEVGALNKSITQWIGAIYLNEKEKVMARMSGQHIGTWHVSGGSTFTHNDNYSYGVGYSRLPQTGLDMLGKKAGQAALAAGSQITNDVLTFFRHLGDETIGKSVGKVLDEEFRKWSKNGNNERVSENMKPDSINGKTNSTEWKVIFAPILEYKNDKSHSIDGNVSKKAGFTLSPDPRGDIAVSVYKASLDSVYVNSSAAVRRATEMSSSDQIYGSYVFFTEGGSSYCPHEGEERSIFYNRGMSVLGNATLYATKPEMSLDTYEQTNIAPDQPAIFHITLANNGQVETGKSSEGEFMHLSLSGGNPDGARVYMDGQNLAAGYPLFIATGQPIVKTIEVYRGTVDDYNDLELMLSIDDCPKVYSLLNFSVHYQPESSPVSIAFPRDKWVMNTLSAKDSIGYYLPVTIDGFNLNHKHFDHIEFQYKLSTENDDAWVNQCSFYADDSLYTQATGNKAKIENGRITPFRFYGDRDPKELGYDLRAVSFCRYGSGFVSKSSPVISGIKDTRPPVLFGKAQPANGILTLEDNISLRFSEPIAGNWLDEDNHFQLRGVTNATGITQSTSLYLGGNDYQFLQSTAGRELAITDLTVDMMIRPADKGRDMVLFAHGDSVNYLQFMLTSDNRLAVILKDDEKEVVRLRSRQMEELSATDFTRVIMVYNFNQETVRFYAGTKDITGDETSVMPYLLQNEIAPLRFGKGLFSNDAVYRGNMMEVRVWTKALTPDEISNTHLRRLTGYEHELMDYYPMNEGSGSQLTDLASGATLSGEGLSWTNPQGISVALTGAPIMLKPESFSRSAAQDYTLMFWFRSDNAQEDSITLFSTALGDSVTMEVGYEFGRLFFRQDDINIGAQADITGGAWHHMALAVSKARNVGTLYLDNRVMGTFSVSGLGALSGTKMELGKGLMGNIDDVCLFEQALPADLISECYRSTPNGDEMGLVALLTFSEMRRNASNVMEQVFSTNDQRVFKDHNGNVVKKVMPLVQGDITAQADKHNYAPVADRGQLTNLHFTWTYHDEELLISLKMQDREINKRTVYLTVRDVEDLNGNRLVSPVSWSVYADLNSLRWAARRVDEQVLDATQDHTFRVGISNTTGMTRQYTIDNLPEWLRCTPEQGTLEAKEEEFITFTVKKGLKPGQHNAVVFLTDDNGLSESLVINLEATNTCPWEDIDTRKYKQNMSLRAQIIIDRDGTESIDTDTRDVVGIFSGGEMLGKGVISGEAYTRGYVYITVYGDASLNNRPLTARLWRYNTAKTHLLSSDVALLFRENACLGCPPDEPVHLRTSNAMMQAIQLDAGWTWTSFCVKPTGDSQVNTTLMADTGFDLNDEIKSPATGTFCRYNDATLRWQGTLAQFIYKHIYMFYTAQEHTLFVTGTALQTEEERTVSLRKGWNVLPYLRTDNMNLRDALTDYFPHATEGDIVKSHDEFAFFSANGKWEGNLTYLQPGRGYLFYRQASERVSFTYPASTDDLPQTANAPAFRNPDAATNMTMIARLSTLDARPLTIQAYQADELVGRAEPMIVDGDTLFFLTISAEQPEEIRFMTSDGQELAIVNAAQSSTRSDRPQRSAGKNNRPIVNRQIVNYIPDSHYGTLDEPVILVPMDEQQPQKILEDGNLFILMPDGTRYSATGKKIE